MGFTSVYEYKPGKQDWFAAGLRMEGSRDTEPTIATVIHTDVPRFGLQERASTMLDAMRPGGWEWAAVVNARGVLLGRVRARDIDDSNAKAEDVMEEGPSTYRPNVGLDELLRRMLDHRFEMAFVTDPDGRLRGLVTRRGIARELEAHRKAS